MRGGTDVDRSSTPAVYKVGLSTAPSGTSFTNSCGIERVFPMRVTNSPCSKKLFIKCSTLPVDVPCFQIARILRLRIVSNALVKSKNTAKRCDLLRRNSMILLLI